MLSEGTAKHHLMSQAVLAMQVLKNGALCVVCTLDCIPCCQGHLSPQLDSLLCWQRWQVPVQIILPVRVILKSSIGWRLHVV